ncbi:MAG: peroxiredoxin [Chloroflexi bacterium]|nr:peroxiredoxin [Chloroflexota bacterium]
MSTPTSPAVGQPAPAFSMASTSGKTVTLDDFKGKQNVVLYFYPEDFTGGCTKEACAFRDLSADFAKAGAAILGVSPDDVASHERFTSQHGLSFPLLADTGGVVSQQYGVWKPRERDGQTVMRVERTTFLIDKQGVVRKVYPQVTVDGHVDEVLKDVAALG